MADIVKPLKMETTPGNIDEFPTEANPAQDLLTGLGFAFGGTDTETIEIDSGGNMVFKDGQTGSKTLVQLASGVSWQQVVIVAKSGGAYTTIQGAIDSITDAADDKRYIVLVMPGEYAENVTLKNYVDLVGSDEYSCLIIPTSGVAITFASTESNISHIGLNCEYGDAGSSIVNVINASGGSHNIDYCRFVATKTGGTASIRLMNATGATLVMSHCYFNLQVSGSGTGVDYHSMIRISSGAMICNDSYLEFNNTETDDIPLAVWFPSGATVPVVAFNNCYFEVENTGSGDATGFYGAAIGVMEVNRSSWIVSANSGDAYGGFISNVALTATTTGNNISITSTSGSAYAGNIGAAATWISNFDSIVAANGSTGAGTITFASSFNSGDFGVSGDFTNGITAFSIAECDGNIVGTGFAQSNGISSTSSNSYSQKVRLSFTPTVAGDYILYMSCNYSCQTLNQINLQIDQDEGTIIWGNYAFAGRGTSDALHASAICKITGLTASAHTFDLDYNSNNGSGTVYIREARLFIRRAE